MKRLLSSVFLLCLITFSGLATVSMQSDPLLVAVLMVKDEEAVIVQTVQPLVEGGIDTFFIFDTGSTDNTMNVVQHYFEQQNVDACIVQEPFIDFATSRNRALDLVEQ